MKTTLSWWLSVHGSKVSQAPLGQRIGDTLGFVSHWLPNTKCFHQSGFRLSPEPRPLHGKCCLSQWTAREATASHHFNHEKWDFSSFFFVGGESFVINQNLPVSCGLGKNHCSSLRGRRAAGHVCVPKCLQVLRVASGLRSTVLALPAFPPVSRAPSQRPA